MTYRELLEFVSWNFQCTHVEGKTRLICRDHGEIAWWDGRLADGDLTLMGEIGEHMDRTGCAPAALPEPELAEKENDR